MELRMVREEEITEELDFARLAAEMFSENDGWTTFTDGDIEPGCLFAVRWGLGDDCVLVMRLDDDHKPTVYQQIIKKETP